MWMKVQGQDHHGQVIHPTGPDPTAFAGGATAFDFADALAREHHAETGVVSAGRVEALENFLDAVRYGG